MPRTRSRHHRKPTRNTANVAAFLVMALITITPALYAVDARMTEAQSELLFQKTWGSIDNTEVGNGVAIDSLGNIYVTGYTFSFGPGNLTARSAVSLLKYDPTGTLIWQRIWSGNGSGGDIGSAVAVDSTGNIYVTGWTSSFGAGMSDILLLKFNSSGSLVWQRTYGGSGDDQGSSVAVDSSGNIYVTGDIQGFGAGSDDVLLLKFDPSGNLLWQKTWGGPRFDYGSGVAVGSSGDVYVTGSTQSFGTGLGHVFLLRVDSSGSLIWQKAWGPNLPGFASGNGVAVNSSDSIYVTGYYASPLPYDALLLKFDSSGNLIWQRTWDGGSWDYGEDVAVDSSGGVYVGGYISAYDVLLLKFDSSGNHAGQVTWGRNEPFSEHGNDIAVDSSGDALVTGFVDAGPPYTLGHPKGTISAPSFSLGVPSFTLDTPTFLLSTPTGIVQTPSGSESNTGSKVNDAFLVKFTPLSYIEDYTENPLVFGLPPIVFYCLVGGIVVLIGVLTTILIRERRKTVTTQSAPAQAEKTTGALRLAKPNRAVLGFAISLASGALNFFLDLMFWQWSLSFHRTNPWQIFTPESFTPPWLAEANPEPVTLGAIATISALIVVIGAILIYMPGKETVACTLVIMFSAIGLIVLGLPFGMFNIIGIIGGALGWTKK